MMAIDEMFFNFNSLEFFWVYYKKQKVVSAATDVKERRDDVDRRLQHFAELDNQKNTAGESRRLMGAKKKIKNK